MDPSPWGEKGMKIGEIALASPFLLAPMAGVTDRPFRILCREMGAGLAVSEMVNANPDLRANEETLLKMNYEGETYPISSQLLGVEPGEMASLAQLNVAQGADIIDINMGCPAKKVCKKAAGSALMQDEALVEAILTAIVGAVDVPVTLKIRTGWDRSHKNAVTIAQMAESLGIQALTVHGRTREDRFMGEAEYETIRQVKAAVSIPVIANGDIDSIEKANRVREYTKADGVMIGRAAMGNPWIFRSLTTGTTYIPNDEERVSVITRHLRALHSFYGEAKALRISRKHLLWYLKDRDIPPRWRAQMLAATSECEQLKWIETIVFRSKEAA